MNGQRTPLVPPSMQDSLPFAAETDEASDAASASDLRAELSDPLTTVHFLLAGNAHVTFQSRRTGTRFTYRIRAAEPRAGDTRPPPHFVAVLTGPDNGASYEYLGTIFGRKMYSHGRKSRIALDAPSAVAFAWAWRHLSGGKMPADLGVWHEGRCGRCSRRLTDPTSIALGLGSACAARLGR